MTWHLISEDAPENQIVITTNQNYKVGEDTSGEHYIFEESNLFNNTVTFIGTVENISGENVQRSEYTRLNVDKTEAKLGHDILLLLAENGYELKL